MIEREITLSYSGVIYSKKNSKRIITNARTGKPQIISNSNAKEQELEMIWSFRDQLKNAKNWEIFDNDSKTYEGRKFQIIVEIWQPDKKRRDLDNQLTAIMDGLVAAGAIPDDSNKFVTDLTVHQSGVDKEDPSAEITIKEARNV